MINVTNRKSGPYVGTGSNSSFPFDFKVFSPADVMVVIADETGQEHTAVITSEYTVTLNPDQDTAPGGYVVTTSPLAAGRKLGITSAVEAKQLVQLTNLGGFYPEVINAALDRLTILVQQLAEKMTRAIVVGLTSNVDTHELVTDLVFETESTLFDAARDAARIATGASAWLSSTTYPSGAVVFGTNGHSYRAVTQSQNVNPVTDVSGTWAKLTIGIGTTALDAFPGDKGNLADIHRQSAHAPSNAQKNSDITKGEIEAKMVGQIGSHSHVLPTPAAIGAAESGHSHSLAALGAAASGHSHTPASIGAADSVHSHSYFPLNAGAFGVGSLVEVKPNTAGNVSYDARTTIAGSALKTERRGTVMSGTWLLWEGCSKQGDIETSGYAQKIAA